MTPVADQSFPKAMIIRNYHSPRLSRLFWGHWQDTVYNSPFQGFFAVSLVHRNRSDFCDLRLRCPSRTPEIARFPRQEKGGKDGSDHLHVVPPGQRSRALQSTWQVSFFLVWCSRLRWLSFLLALSSASDVMEVCLCKRPAKCRTLSPQGMHFSMDHPCCSAILGAVP